MDRLSKVPLEHQLTTFIPIVAAQPRRLETPTDPWELQDYRFDQSPTHTPLSLEELRREQNNNALGALTVGAEARTYMPQQDPWTTAGHALIWNQAVTV